MYDYFRIIYKRQVISHLLYFTEISQSDFKNIEVVGTRGCRLQSH